MALCLCGQVQGNAKTTDDGTNGLVSSVINEDMLRQIEPTYLKRWQSLLLGLPTGSLVCRVAHLLLLESHLVQGTCSTE